MNCKNLHYIIIIIFYLSLHGVLNKILFVLNATANDTQVNYACKSNETSFKARTIFFLSSDNETEHLLTFMALPSES